MGNKHQNLVVLAVITYILISRLARPFWNPERHTVFDKLKVKFVSIIHNVHFFFQDLDFSTRRPIKSEY